MSKLIVGNWKENPRSEAQALKLFRAVARSKSSNAVEVAVCPPFIYLEKIAEVRRRGKKRNTALGAQDVFWEEKGPYTSEVGPRMLRSLGVRYVIIGHSERRRWLKETDAMVNKKIKLALKDNLVPILCVGEPLAVRRRGLTAAKKFVHGQLQKDLSGLSPSSSRSRSRKKSTSRRLVIAYEPIWAIGTGRYDNPQDASEMSAFIKNSLIKTDHSRARVLYGGSVNGKNIARYIQYKSVDGALVGGASLNAQEFKKIIAAAAKLKTNG